MKWNPDLTPEQYAVLVQLRAYADQAQDPSKAFVAISGKALGEVLDLVEKNADDARRWRKAYSLVPQTLDGVLAEYDRRAALSQSVQPLLGPLF